MLKNKNMKIGFLHQAAIAVALLLSTVSCQNKQQLKQETLKKKYADLHDKYRTFWYRTDKRCFYDSTKKYGLLYDSICGKKPIDLSDVDTTDINEPAICK